MLILELKDGENISLINKDTGIELGKIKRIRPHGASQNKLLLGFDFDQSIQITRSTLISGKDTENVKANES